MAPINKEGMLIDDADILNIEYHTARLIVKALNKHKDLYKVAFKVGFSERTLYRKIESYQIKRNHEGVFICHRSFRVMQGIIKID